tara:strand:- start:4145 stop:4729 length:585 start_codon:yes stop_codon:yes gene_type:complete
MIEVREVTSETEREAVFRFRYRIYVQDQGRQEPYADHERRTLREPLDERGWVLGAFQDGRVVGTLRTNPRRDGSLDGYESLYGIDRLPTEVQEQVAITTKLMVEPNIRGGLVALRLAKLTYAMALERDVSWNYVDARDETVPLFEKLGHRVLRRDLEHPAYGRANLMCLSLRDIDHLVQVQSPFVSLLQLQITQ